MVSERNVPLLDLQAQYKSIREEILAEVTRVIDSQQFILGEEVAKLERALSSEYCGTAHAVHPDPMLYYWPSSQLAFSAMTRC